MRAAYHRRCEAGINGGNPELDRKSRQAQLDMDRNTNPLNRRHFATGLREFYGLPKRERAESEASSLIVSSTLAAVPADSGVLRPAANENQERDNPEKALNVHALSRR